MVPLPFPVQSSLSPYASNVPAKREVAPSSFVGDILVYTATAPLPLDHAGT